MADSLYDLTKKQVRKLKSSKDNLSKLSDTQLSHKLATSGVRGKWKLEEEFKQRSIGNPTIHEQLKRAKTKEAKRDKSGDFVLKANGGYVKKYAKGGSVNKAWNY